jgi:uncharacterized membrane protein
MPRMEAESIWRILLLASLMVFPQLLGVLLYLRVTRFSKWIGRVLGVLVPAVSFFFLAPHFFFAGMREAAERGDLNCGMPAMAAAFMLLLGTGVHFLAALVVQLYLSKRQRMSV